ncbi:hypothetical protein [Shewanella scandinavica]|uniref:hypothetical protein n=1 Tax=Shewanella scandinavica TaxID=3063538 RepID=UPI0031937BA7
MSHTYRTLFTWIIVLFPILAIYASPIAKVSIGDIALFLTLPVVCLRYFFGRKSVFSKVQFTVILFVLYIAVAFLIQIFSDFPVEFISTARYIFFLLVLIFGYDYFDSKSALKYITAISVVLSVWVMFQFISFYFFTIIIPWNIPFLPVIDNKFIEVVNEPYFLQYYRPTGVFYEPTHFVQYTLIALIANVVVPSFRSASKRFILIMAIIMSASSLGLIALILVFLYKVFIVDGLKISPIYILLFLALLIVITPLLSSIEYFSFIVTRVIDVESGGLGPAFGYRFDSLKELFTNTDIIKWLFGTGRGSEDAYFTGIFYLLNSIGLIGLILYFAIIVCIVRKSNQFGKMLAIIVFLLSFGSEIVANYGLLFYIPFCKFDGGKI